ncbi:MAG: NADH-quinone oxidoreductase subunit NuoE [bacterium]
MNPVIVDEIIDRYKRKKSALIGILQDVQAEYNYLPKEALLRVRESLNIPLTQIYSIASFYKSFSLKPRGEHIINVCLGTACHVRGAVRILERIESDLRIKSGQTSRDSMFTLETVNCLGACALGPLMVVDGQYHGKMTPGKVEKVLKNYRGKNK